jgi:alkylation response protein AidB-like acyl-CoA dehydrogenase
MEEAWTSNSPMSNCTCRAWCGIPGENLLGVKGQGFVDAMRLLEGGRISIASLGLGMATRATSVPDQSRS